ncbi:MAG: hypothetical protein HYZ37_08720 [Candidatus Solibacter usitatus]|nr:hypothetical protein [Candidatus Solibacter usitatus]
MARKPSKKTAAAAPEMVPLLTIFIRKDVLDSLGGANALLAGGGDDPGQGGDLRGGGDDPGQGGDLRGGGGPAPKRRSRKKS